MSGCILSGRWTLNRRRLHLSKEQSRSGRNNRSPGVSGYRYMGQRQSRTTDRDGAGRGGTGTVTERRDGRARGLGRVPVPERGSLRPNYAIISSIVNTTLVSCCCRFVGCPSREYEIHVRLPESRRRRQQPASTLDALPDARLENSCSLSYKRAPVSQPCASRTVCVDQSHLDIVMRHEEIVPDVSHSRQNRT